MESQQILVNRTEKVIKELEKPPSDIHSDHNREKHRAANPNQGYHGLIFEIRVSSHVKTSVCIASKNVPTAHEAS